MDAASEGIATKIAWFIYLLVMLILTGVPTYFVLKGYGQIDSGSEAKV
jgi:amino acid permease